MMKLLLALALAPAAVSAMGKISDDPPIVSPDCEGKGPGWTETLETGVNYAVSSECTSYKDWRAALTGEERCISVEANGAIQKCDNPTAAAQITSLIKTGTGGVTIDCDGIPWTVGTCGAGVTCFTANGPGNTCAPAGPDGVLVRPCHPDGLWGGGNGPTCNGPTQTFVVKTD